MNFHSKDIVSTLMSTTHDQTIQFHWNPEANWVVYKFVMMDAFTISIGGLPYYNNHTYSDSRDNVRMLWNRLVDEMGWVVA